MNAGVKVNVGDLNVAATPTQARIGTPATGHSGANCFAKCVRCALYDQQRSLINESALRVVRKSAKVVLPFELFAAKVNASQLPQLTCKDPSGFVGGLSMCVCS